MSTSPDYEVFMDDAIAYFNRMRSYYTGKMDAADQNPDLFPWVSLWDTKHLALLNLLPLPLAYKTVYGEAYNHMRALLRAGMVASYTRKDFYNMAADDAKTQAELYKHKLATFKSSLSVLDDRVDEFTLRVLGDLTEMARRDKTTLEDKTRQLLGAYPADRPITLEVIRALAENAHNARKQAEEEQET